MTDGERLANAAAQMIGVRFRLYGRDPRTGLDCVGLVAACLAAIGYAPTIPRGYRLRNTAIDQWLGLAELSALHRAIGKQQTGDVILTTPGPAQNHLLIVEAPGTVIHAHAGLGRVVRQSLDAATTPLAQWRLAPITKDN